jgi:hypothetical protein
VCTPNHPKDLAPSVADLAGDLAGCLLGPADMIHPLSPPEGRRKCHLREADPNRCSVCARPTCRQRMAGGAQVSPPLWIRLHDHAGSGQGKEKSWEKHTVKPTAHPDAGGRPPAALQGTRHGLIHSAEGCCLSQERGPRRTGADSDRGRRPGTTTSLSRQGVDLGLDLTGSLK